MENEPGVPYCSENIVKRLIYNACGPLSRFWKCKAKSSLHWPKYLQTVPNVSQGKGFQVQEIQRTSRFIGVQRFRGSDTMSERLGWTSGGSSSSSASDADSSNGSTVSGDGTDSVVTEVLDRAPGSVYGEEEIAKQLRKRNYCHSIVDSMSDISRSSSPRSLSMSDRPSSRPTYAEAFHQYGEDGDSSDLSSDTEAKFVGRGAGRGISRIVTYGDKAGSSNSSSSSRVGAEPGPSRKNVAPLAKSNVEKLSSSFGRLKFGAGSTVSSASSEGTFVRPAGRGLSRFRRGPPVSPSVVSDSSEGEVGGLLEFYIYFVLYCKH